MRVHRMRTACALHVHHTHARLAHAQVGVDAGAVDSLDGPRRLRRAVLEFRQRVRLVRRLHVLDTARDASVTSASSVVGSTRAQLAAAVLEGLPAGVVRRVVVDVG